MMAEKALKKVEDQLSCSICLDTYTDPKLLQCFHVYCQACLVRLVFRDQQGQLVLTCPTCRQVTPVPANGVAGLQPAFLVNHLLEILEKEKDELACAGRVENLPPPHEKATALCSEHAKELELYCGTCGELICYHCALKTGKHRDHDYSLLEEAFEQYKKEISSSLEPVKKQLTSVAEVLAQFDQRSAEISDQRAIIEADIHDTIRQLHEVLDIRRSELIGRLHQITQRKMKDLAAQRDQVETLHAQLSSCLDFMEKSIGTSSQGEVLKMKTRIVKQVKELTTTVQPDIFEPNTEADIVFSASANITALCRNFGQVSTPGLRSPDPSKCQVTGRGMEVASVGETSTAVLQAFNYEGEPCTETVSSLACKLVSEITGAEAKCRSERRKENQYEISYQPTIKGWHQLLIIVEGQHIRGSPFSVAAMSSVKNLRGPIQNLYCTRKLWGVVINHKGEIVVSERGWRCVSVFSRSGKKIKNINTKGLALFGLALDREGNVLVAEDTTHSIQKFSLEGNFLASVGKKGSGRLQFKSPKDIAFNTSNNKLFVVENGNHRIQVLNSDLTFSATFGKKGKDKGEFNMPSGVACDSAGNVYVADSANSRIQVFTAEGNFLRKFGKYGGGRGELDWPICIALDHTNNHVYVSESTNHRVSVFTCEGQFVTSFGDTVENFDPRGLAVDTSGVVYVCDFNKCIRLF